MSTDRLQALCDGVFAIALTLLVLELPIPEESHRLAHDLLAAWPSYAAYLVSFVTLGIVWVNHHALMDNVVRADRALLELNLALLLFVALVPWPTAIAADYLREAEQATAAAVTYGLAMAALASAFASIWLYLKGRDDLCRPGMRPGIGPAARRSLVGPVIYLLGVALAFVWAPIAFALYAGVAAFFAISRRANGPGPAHLGNAQQGAAPR